MLYIRWIKIGLSSNTLFQALAEADVHEVVSTICEISLDFRALDSHVFTVGGDAWTELNAGKKFADGIKTALSALKSTSATFTGVNATFF